MFIFKDYVLVCILISCSSDAFAELKRMAVLKKKSVSQSGFEEKEETKEVGIEQLSID